MKKIGLMGCGTVADYGHIPVIQSTEGLELHAVFEPNPERLRQMQEKHGIRLGFSDENALTCASVVIQKPFLLAYWAGEPRGLVKSGAAGRSASAKLPVM